MRLSDQYQSDCCESPVPLSTLPGGSVATIAGSTVPDDATALLSAMGLSNQNRLKVCRVGDPCIVKVRSTRFGISSVVARNILVQPVRE